MSWNRATVRTTNTGGQLLGALAGDLRALPGPINRRVELFRVARRPDLLADNQILGIPMEGVSPLLDRFLVASYRIEQTPKAQLCLDQLALGGIELVRNLRRWAWPRVFAAQEALDRADVLGLLDRKAAELAVADHSVSIDENAIGDRFEAEYGRSDPILVNQRGEAHVSRLDKRPSALAAVVLHGDRDELKIRGLVFLVEALPPGQLLAAASPGAPKEQQRALASEIREAELAIAKPR